MSETAIRANMALAIADSALSTIAGGVDDPVAVATDALHRMIDSVEIEGGYISRYEADAEGVQITLVKPVEPFEGVIRLEARADDPALQGAWNNLIDSLNNVAAEDRSKRPRRGLKARWSR